MSFETQLKDLLNVLGSIGDGLNTINIFSDGGANVEDSDEDQLITIDDVFDYKEMEKAICELEKFL